MISNIYKAKEEGTNNWVTGYIEYYGYIVHIIQETTHKKYIVNKDTICKRIDVKDRNGNWIYEGDVVQITQRSSKKAVVEYDKENLCWRLNLEVVDNDKKRWADHYKPLFTCSTAKLCKVLGNIYD